MIRSAFRSYVIQTFKRTDKTDEINQAIDDTLRDIASRHAFQELTEMSYVSTVDGQPDYPLPSDLNQLFHPVKITDGNATSDDGTPLTFISKEEYDNLEPNPFRTSPDTGTPFAYCIWRKQILLTDIPDDQAYLLVINWAKEITVPAGDSSEVGPWGDKYNETIKWGVLMRLYEIVEMFDEKERFSGYYEFGISKMINNDNDISKGIGKVTPRRL